VLSIHFDLERECAVLRTSTFDEYIKCACGAPMLELEIDEIRYHDSRTLVRLITYHIISERIITHKPKKEI
jgi:hypothetical protein